jgi:hypothetical protein
MAKTIVMSEVINRISSNADSSRKDPVEFHAELAMALREHGEICIDLANVEGLSPSFAYEAFAKLIDKFGTDVSKKISFRNDDLNLADRIYQAFDRRKAVLAISTKSG